MRIALGSPRLGLVMVAAAFLITACDRSADAPAPSGRQPAPAPVKLPTPPAPDPVLNRADILQAVGRAASAFGAGAPYPEAVARLAGQRFEVAAPFGCDGPGPPEAASGYTFDKQRRSMTLVVRPLRVTNPLWVRAFTDSDEVEDLEGFWLRRPWIASADCPAKVPVAAGAQASSETVGLVQVFEAGGSRVRRRGDRPYQITVKTSPDDIRAVPGFRMILQGRIAEASGRPVRCRSGSPDQRPICLVSVQFERVAFLDWQGETLAEWRE